MIAEVVLVIWKQNLLFAKLTPEKRNCIHKINHIFFCLWNYKIGKKHQHLKINKAQKSWVLQKTLNKEERKNGYRLVQSSKVKNLPQDMPVLCGNTSLETVGLEKLVKGTNLDTVTYLVSQGFAVAKI